MQKAGLNFYQFHWTDNASKSIYNFFLWHYIYIYLSTVILPSLQRSYYPTKKQSKLTQQHKIFAPETSNIENYVSSRI